MMKSDWEKHRERRCPPSSASKLFDKLRGLEADDSVALFLRCTPSHHQSVLELEQSLGRGAPPAAAVHDMISG